MASATAKKSSNVRVGCFFLQPSSRTKTFQTMFKWWHTRWLTLKKHCQSNRQFRYQDWRKMSPQLFLVYVPHII